MTNSWRRTVPTRRCGGPGTDSRTSPARDGAAAARVADAAAAGPVPPGLRRPPGPAAERLACTARHGTGASARWAGQRAGPVRCRVGSGSAGPRPAGAAARRRSCAGTPGIAGLRPGRARCAGSGGVVPSPVLVPDRAMVAGLTLAPGGVVTGGRTLAPGRAVVQCCSMVPGGVHGAEAWPVRDRPVCAAEGGGGRRAGGAAGTRAGPVPLRGPERGWKAGRRHRLEMSPGTVRFRDGRGLCPVQRRPAAVHGEKGPVPTPWRYP